MLWEMYCLKRAEVLLSFHVRDFWSIFLNENKILTENIVGYWIVLF